MKTETKNPEKYLYKTIVMYALVEIMCQIFTL